MYPNMVLDYSIASGIYGRILLIHVIPIVMSMSTFMHAYMLYYMHTCVCIHADC